jgi:hypothetical protein
MTARASVSGAALLGAWLFGGASASAQGAAAGQPAFMCGGEVVKTLAGAWKAPEYKMRRAAGESDLAVFGPNAFDVRNVDLTLEPSGEGVLKISTSVLDQKGKSWAPTVIEAKLAVSPPKAPAAGRCEPAVAVTSAEERYMDETNYRAPINGAHAMMIVDPGGKRMDVRFETPKGPGSFWTTLTRQAPRAK